MIYIAHRGNMFGPNLYDENKPDYLLKAIKSGFYVETDLWIIDSELFLGHDHPQYKIDIDFLINIKDKLFCHCKNIDALNYILTYYPFINCFFHDKDDCVLTSNNLIWTFPGKKLTSKSICVMPEYVNQVPDNICYGICTDYINKYINI
jgi:hypothetical protein